nr:uncharacterized protein LOC109174480 [Ipomoea batatas]
MAAWPPISSRSQPIDNTATNPAGNQTTGNTAPSSSTPTTGSNPSEQAASAEEFHPQIILPTMGTIPLEAPEETPQTQSQSSSNNEQTDSHQLDEIPVQLSSETQSPYPDTSTSEQPWSPPMNTPPVSESPRQPPVVTQPVTRRSTRQKQTPNYLQDYICQNATVKTSPHHIEKDSRISATWHQLIHLSVVTVFVSSQTCLIVGLCSGDVKLQILATSTSIPSHVSSSPSSSRMALTHSGMSGGLQAITVQRGKGKAEDDGDGDGLQLSLQQPFLFGLEVSPNRDQIGMPENAYCLHVLQESLRAGNGSFSGVESFNGHDQLRSHNRLERPRRRDGRSRRGVEERRSSARLVHNLAAKIRVQRERRNSELRQSRSYRYRTVEVVVGDVEYSQFRLVQRRNGAVEAVRVEAEVVQPVQNRQFVRKRTGEIVIREIENEKTVRNSAGERVVLQAQNSELVKPSERIGGEDPSETEALENETHHSPLSALHALPFTVVKPLVKRVKQPAIKVRLGLERQQRNGVGGEQRAHERHRRRGGIVGGADSRREIAVSLHEKKEKKKRRRRGNSAPPPPVSHLSRRLVRHCLERGLSVVLRSS